MKAYIVRRLLLLVPTLVGISLLAFGLANLAPGDPAETFLRRVLEHQPSPAEVAALRTELGLDRPLLVQYLDWLGDAARGDLGISYGSRRPVVQEIRRRLPFTLELAVPAAALALAVAIPVGVVSAVRRNRLADQVVRVLSLAGASMPSFWLALLLILFFAVRLALVPAAGRQGPSSILLPVLALALLPAAVLARFTRSALLETFGEEYVRMARAKGLSAGRVVGRHALRNGLVPVITAFALSFGHLLVGAVVIETIFVWPGLGSLALDAIKQRDYPMLQAFVLYTGTAFVALNLLVDLAYPVIDPRIRLHRRQATR
ncbi:MAG: ABC transporter permease [Actinomycetota bacterium]|nr:ABC transporter permease [Actinomycetota bacterium]